MATKKKNHVKFYSGRYFVQSLGRYKRSGDEPPIQNWCIYKKEKRKKRKKKRKLVLPGEQLINLPPKNLIYESLPRIFSSYLAPS